MIFLTKLNKKNKTIIISEDQHRAIMGEAADEVFTTNDLTIPDFSAESFSKVVNYCEQHCGKSIGCGSSRAVFQIDDEKVLKLGIFQKGIAQNKAEIAVYAKYKGFGLFPQIYDYDQNGLWLVSEYVLPAEPKDFTTCLGIRFGDLCNLVDYIDYSQGTQIDTSNFFYSHDEKIKKYADMLDSMKDTPFIKELSSYIINGNAPVGDITVIDNWGLAKRNGGAMPVLLDSGFTTQIWEDYYR